MSIENLWVEKIKFEIKSKRDLLRTVIIGSESSWVPPRPKTILPRYLILITSKQDWGRSWCVLTSRGEAKSSWEYLFQRQERKPSWRTLPRKVWWLLPASKIHIIAEEFYELMFGSVCYPTFWVPGLAPVLGRREICTQWGRACSPPGHKDQIIHVSHVSEGLNKLAKLGDAIEHRTWHYHSLTHPLTG